LSLRQGAVCGVQRPRLKSRRIFAAFWSSNGRKENSSFEMGSRPIPFLVQFLCETTPSSSHQKPRRTLPFSSLVFFLRLANCIPRTKNLFSWRKIEEKERGWKKEHSRSNYRME
jgi:hypothetical protein